MASVTNPKRPAVAPQTDDQYNQFIDRRLRQTSDHVKLVDLFGGLMLLLGGLLASLLCLSLIDAWVLELNRPLRLLALIAIVGTFAGYFFYQILPLLLRKLNPAYSAQMIEQGHPELKNSLLNHVFFRRSPKSAPPVVERAVHRKAAEDLSHISIETAVDRSFLIHAAYFFVGVIALFGIYKIFSPKDPFQTIARVATPFADISRPAIVRISELDPGDAEVFFGDALVVSARLRGLRETQPVHLVYSTDDGQTTERKLLMQAEEQERYAIELKTTDSGIQHDLHYWIVAGDAISPQYQVRVRTRPSITVESVSISPPSYTELEAYAQTQGNVASVEGAKITLQTKANLPISSASIQLLAQRTVAAIPTEGGAPAANEDRAQEAYELVSVSSITMKIEDDTRAVGTFYLQMLTDRTAPKFTHYRVSFYTHDGATNENATIYRVLTTPDLKPEVELLRPNETVHQLPENRTLRLEVHALDPDYELSDIRLVADAHGVQFFDRSIVKTNTQLGSRGEVTLDFQPDAFGLRAGNEVMVYAAALDNRHAPISDALDPNVTRTRQIRIQVKPRLIDPARNDPSDANDNSDDSTAAQQPDPQIDATQDQQQPRDPQEKGNPQDDPQQNDPKQQDPSKQNSQAQDPENKAGQPPKKEESDPNKQNSDDQKSNDQNSDDQDSSESKTDSQNEQGKPKQGNESEDGDKSNPNQKESGNSGQQSSSSDPQQDQSSDANSQQNSDSSQNSSSPQGNNNKSNSPNSTGEKSANALPGDQASDSQPNDAAGKQNGSQANDSSADPQQSGVENSNDQVDSEPTDAPVDHPGEAIKRIKQHAEERQQAEKDRAPDQDSASQSDDKQTQSDADSQTDMANQQSNSDGSEANSDKQPNRTEQPDVNKDPSEPDPKKESGSSTNEDAADQKSNAQTGDQQDSAKPDKSDANDSKNSDASQTDPKNGKPQADDSQSVPDAANTSDDAQQNSSDSKDPANKADPQQAENDSDKGADGSQNADDKESQQKPKGNGNQQKTDPDKKDQQTSDSAGKGNDPQDESADEKPAGNADEKSDKGNDPSSEKGGNQSETSQDPDSKAQSANEGNKSQDTDPSDKSGGQTKSDANNSKSPSGDNSNKQNNTSDNAKSSGDDQAQKKGEGDQGDQSGKSESSSSKGDVVGKGNQQGTPDGEPVDDRSPADDPNLEYSRKATELVLDYLKDQEKRNDKELLDELNWSEEEMQQFYEKWQQMRDRAVQGTAEERQQFEEALRSLGLAPGSAQVERQQIRKQQIDGLQEKGTRSKPPAHLLEEFRSFNKSRSRADR